MHVLHLPSRVEQSTVSSFLLGCFPAAKDHWLMVFIRRQDINFVTTTSQNCALQSSVLKINTSNCSYLMDSEHQTVSRKSFSFSHSPDCCSDWDYVLLLTYAFPFLSLEHYAHSTSSLIWGINDSVYQKSDLTKKIISKILFFFFFPKLYCLSENYTLFFNLFYFQLDHENMATQVTCHFLLILFIISG